MITGSCTPKSPESSRISDSSNPEVIPGLSASEIVLQPEIPEKVMIKKHKQQKVIYVLVVVIVYRPKDNEYKFC